MLLPSVVLLTTTFLIVLDPGLSGKTLALCYFSSEHCFFAAYTDEAEVSLNLSLFVSVLVGEFTDQPSELRGYSVHTRVCKGPQGFGFNLAGGSRPREFIQIYSITPGGPSTLNTGNQANKRSGMVVMCICVCLKV